MVIVVVKNMEEAKPKEEKKEMESKEKPKVEPKAEPQAEVNTPKFVEVIFNGSTGWTISYHGRGNKVIMPGETAKFNIYEKQQLHALLQVLKNVNTENINTRTIVNKQNKAKPYEYIKRWEVLNGLEHLPKVLQDIQFGENNFPSEEEQKAIVSLVPNYYLKEKKLYEIGR